MPKTSRMDAVVALEYACDGSLFALALNDQRKAQLRVHSESVGDEFQVTAYVAAGIQFGNVVDDGPPDFVRMGQFLVVQVLVQEPEHVRAGPHGVRPERVAL